MCNVKNVLLYDVMLETVIRNDFRNIGGLYHLLLKRSIYQYLIQYDRLWKYTKVGFIDNEMVCYHYVSKDKSNFMVTIG